MILNMDGRWQAHSGGVGGVDHGVRNSGIRAR